MAGANGGSRPVGLITSDAVWEGGVTVDADVIVAAGATLTVRAGARVHFPARVGGLSWKRCGRGTRISLGSDGARHIKVLGSVRIEGTPESAVLFDGPGFGGILLGGRARLSARGAGFGPSAAFAVSCADLSSASLTACRLEGGLGAVFCCGFSRAVLRRCRLIGGSKTGLWACDDSRVRAADCSVEESAWALAAEGLARVALRGCRFAGNARGADLAGSASLRSSGCEWRGHETAILAQSESATRFSGDRFVENGTAIEALGRAVCAARRCRFERNRTAAFFQRRARFAADGLDLSGNAVGLHACHESRLVVSRSRIRGSRLATRREDLAETRFDAVEIVEGPPA